VETDTSSGSLAGAGAQGSGTSEHSADEGGSGEEDSATGEEGSGTVATEPPAEPERVKADVGGGKKGRSLDEFDSGVQAAIAGPAKAYFGMREKVVFQNLIPKAMQLYKGMNGNAPKSHDEFMSQIIEANNIQLPELPDGHKYVYDPQKEELMIEK